VKRAVSRGTSPWIWVGRGLAAVLLGSYLFLLVRHRGSKAAKLDSVAVLERRMANLDETQNKAQPDGEESDDKTEG